VSHPARCFPNLLLVLLSAAVTLLGLELALRALTRDGSVLGTKLVGPGLIDRERILAHMAELLSVYDPDLGWIAQDESRGSGGAGGPRGPRRYASEAPPGVLRIAAFGESFTRGDGVPAGASWPAQIEADSGGQIEVLNFGVGAYGLDQAYLCFRRHAAAYHPDVVLVGLTHHAIERTTNLYYPFYSNGTGFGLGKPRFVLDGDSLRPVLTGVPGPAGFLDLLPGFARHPLRRYEAYYDPTLYELSPWDRSRLHWFVRSRLAWHRRVGRFAAECIMDPEGEEMRLARALTRRMAAEAEGLGARFAAVLLPTHRMLRLLADGQDLWAPFRSDLAAAGIPFWDVQAVFAQTSEFGRYFLPDGHLTADGNGRVAAEVRGHLAAARPAGPGLGRYSPPPRIERSISRDTPPTVSRATESQAPSPKSIEP
jgi:hypothetical protein